MMVSKRYGNTIEICLVDIFIFLLEDFPGDYQGVYQGRLPGESGRK